MKITIRKRVDKHNTQDKVRKKGKNREGGGEERLSFRKSFCHEDKVLNCNGQSSICGIEIMITWINAHY